MPRVGWVLGVGSPRGGHQPRLLVILLGKALTGEADSGGILPAAREVNLQS